MSLSPPLCPASAAYARLLCRVFIFLYCRLNSDNTVGKSDPDLRTERDYGPRAISINTVIMQALGVRKGINSL